MKRQLKNILTNLIALTLYLDLSSYSLILSYSCSSTIKISKQTFSITEPILISYSIKNVSKDTVKIWHCGFWCNNKIVVTDSNDIEIPRTDWGKTTLSAFSPGGDGNKNFPVTLNPNETDSAYEEYNLKDHFSFRHYGVYNITYFYHEIDDKGEIKIESNTVRIQIVN